MIHSRTRNKQIIQLMYSLGLSVSYARVLEVEKQMATSLCDRYKADSMVIPRNALKNTFTICSMDNINQNPSSNLSTKSLHGTMCALHQHPTELSIAQPELKISKETKKIELP